MSRKESYFTSVKGADELLTNENTTNYPNYSVMGTNRQTSEFSVFISQNLVRRPKPWKTLVPSGKEWD